MEAFDDARGRLEKQYENAVFDPASGWTAEALRAEFSRRARQCPDEPRILRRAFLHSLILARAPVVPEPENAFAGKVETFGLLDKDCLESARAAWTREFGDFPGWCSVYDAERGVGYMVDMSHVSPDWDNILRLGLPGLRARAAAAGDAPFHRACAMLLDGAIALCRRLGRLGGHAALLALADRPPETLREAFQLSYLFHEIVELGGASIRTMGRFDRQYIDFYRRDLAAGRLTREAAKELIKHFWIAFYAKHQGRRFGKNFCFGPDFNELSHLGMEAYYEMDAVDPKLSVLFRDDMPDDFLARYARCIRDGRTGIVTLNDGIAIAGLVGHGREPADAANYIPVGCYEPAVLGKEISLSGATLLNLPVMVLRTLARGVDYPSFGDFKQAFFEELFEQSAYMAAQQRRCEKIWPQINPAPLLSATFDECVARGKDISEGGAKYNTTGCVVSYLADAVDSLAAVEMLAYEQRHCTLAELRRALAADWNGHERLRLLARNRAPKWGNNDARADRLAEAISAFLPPRLSSLDNGRGGKMFPSLYGQLVVENGKRVGALPSGRRAGEPMSKNLDAAVGMDRNGVTALMNSALKLDFRQWPCGACLDLMLHPSAVAGDDGLDAIKGLIRSFMAGGGTGLQFNVFDAAALRDAQLHPENHANLQVRVCGWNARFIDLSAEAQATFIGQAECMTG